ncbi:MAG: hypothetical protein J3Q66DRAFT_142449 [Benniella sp.]|nr:MAG: hypothetical protein J3Q66DRAFT_142449 [Benniella sp.]
MPTKKFPRTHSRMPGIKLYVMEWQLPTSTSGNCWSDKGIKSSPRRSFGRQRNRWPALQTIYASSPGGYAVRISQYHDAFKVTSTIEGFPTDIRILTHLLRTKELLVKAKGIMEKLPGDSDSDDTTSTSRPTLPLESKKRRVPLPPLQENPFKRR